MLARANIQFVGPIVMVWEKLHTRLTAGRKSPSPRRPSATTAFCGVSRQHLGGVFDELEPQW